MTEARILRTFRNQAELIEALREVVRLRGTTFAAVDEIGGLPSGYSAKILGPKPVKHLGRMSLEAVLGALAVQGALLHDDEQLARIDYRLHKRNDIGARQENSTVTLHISRRFYRQISALAAKARKPGRHLKRIAKLGGQARARALPPERRKLIAREAAQARWNAYRIADVASIATASPA
jgi:hypothetical protein